MNRALLLAAVASVALTGCQNDPLCINCPDLTGSWSVSQSNDNSTGDCSTFGLGDADGQTLNITQNGATLTSALYGFALSGSLFQSHRFSLQGSNTLNTSPDAGTSDFGSLDLEGSANVPDTGTATLTGTLTGTFSDSSGESVTVTCTLDRDFTALR